MAKTLNSVMSLTLTGMYKNETDALTYGVPSNELSISENDTMSTGTSANQSDLRYHISTTRATGGTDTYDVYGTLTDVFGDTLSMAVVTAVFVKNNTSSTGADLTLGGTLDIFSDASDIMVLEPEGIIFWYSPVDGAAVSAGTTDSLTLTNASGTTISYDLVIIGRSA